MINPNLSHFEKEVWAMEPAHLTSFYNQILSFDSAKLAELMKIEIIKNKSQLAVDNGVAKINIHALLMKNPPSWLAWLGIETTDYVQIAEQLKQAIENPEVNSILLHIDSPGGSVAGVSEAAEAIVNANKVKPVTAYIEDLGASGAYYLASQAGKIFINPNGEAGSIGVYTVAVDSSAFAEKLGLKIHVIRSGEHKGMGVPGAAITENQIAVQQEIVNGMAKNFKTAVAVGRKMSIDAIEKIATGRVWLAEDAKRLNLVDEIVNGINKIQLKQNSNMKGNTMPEPKSQQEIQKEAQAAEVQRMNDIKAAIPNDLAFAMEQFVKGASVVEAKAAYADKLQEKNAALQKEKEDLQKNKTAKTPEGAVPVETNEDSPAAAVSDSDFMTEAKAYAKENKCSMKQAVKAVRGENPEKYENFLHQSLNTKIKIGAERTERIRK